MRDLIVRASAYGLMLPSDGLHLRVAPVTREPIPGAIRAELAAQKAELLACLRCHEAAE